MTDIELRGNSIGGEGLSAIGQALRLSSTIRSLSLDWNNLGSSGDAGLQRFFTALAENRSLVKLDLNNNELGPEVGPLIASCLKSNTTLETLDLKWNRLGNQGAKAILKGLNLNKTLTILELSGNKVSDDYLRQVNDFLVRNKSGEAILASHSSHQVQRSGFNAKANEYPILNMGQASDQLPPKLSHFDGGDEDFINERQQIEERRLDMARELEEEARKRRDAEEVLDRLKEECIRRELEEAR